jgi:Carboxypeptidase regulatory-like domain
MLSRQTRTWLTLLLTVGLTSIAGIAQVQNGSVIGTVTDPSGAVLPHAQVTGVSLTTGTQYVTTTTTSGEYTFPSLPIGRYTISVRIHGFKTAVRSQVSVEVAQRQAVNFRMQLGNIVQTVQVTSSIPPLETQSASPGLVVVNRYVQDLPLKHTELG